MTTPENERKLEKTRAEIVEAIDWIDAERKRLSRFCFAETRKRSRGDRGRGKQITLMKKQSEWLYKRRCALREKIGVVNTALKDIRRARSGKVAENFGAVFVKVAKEKLAEDTFDDIMREAVQRFGDKEASDASDAPESDLTVLDELKRDMEAYMAPSDTRPPRAPSPRDDRRPPARKKRPRRETQADFGIADTPKHNRIFAPSR